VATATIAGCRCTTRPPPPRPPRPSSLVAAIRIDEEQYPTVAEFTVRLAEDHAKAGSNPLDPVRPEDVACGNAQGPPWHP